MSTPNAEFLSREQLLSPPGLREKVVEFKNWGKVLCVELTGKARAAITEKQIKAMESADAEKVTQYQQQLLAKGIADADSPEGARVPLLRAADVPVLMEKLGGGKVRELLNTIEELSGMGVHALEVAKGNSETAPSGGGSSA